ncbi:MAG TPA: hypothetical protein VFK89_10370 [Actinomycetota bacterium]|nr:hypothetical protein [Actinomycetota bacterium]
MTLSAVTEHAVSRLASKSSRRSFLGRFGKGIVALVGGPVVASVLAPGRAEAYHFCGHTYTTDSCPHPYAPLSRVDRYGYPVHPKKGYPVDDKGDMYISHQQKRSLMCQEMVPRRYPYTGHPTYGGGWHRCCNGRVRRIADCCSYSRTRINGDASVTGYCYNGKRVFCVGYRELDIPC